MCSLLLNKYSQLLCYQAAVSPVSVYCWRLFSICLWEVELRGWVKHYHAGQLFTADKPNCLMMLALPSCASSRSHFCTFYGLNSINSGQILHNFNLSGCCKVSNSYWAMSCYTPLSNKCHRLLKQQLKRLSLWSITRTKEAHSSGTKLCIVSISF